MSGRMERYKQIGDVLSRHGFGFFASVAGLGRWIPFHHNRRNGESHRSKTGPSYFAHRTQGLFGRAHSRFEPLLWRKAPEVLF